MILTLWPSLCRIELGAGSGLVGYVLRNCIESGPPPPSPSSFSFTSSPPPLPSLAGPREAFPPTPHYQSTTQSLIYISTASPSPSTPPLSKSTSPISHIYYQHSNPTWHSMRPFPPFTLPPSHGARALCLVLQTCSSQPTACISSLPSPCFFKLCGL